MSGATFETRALRGLDLLLAHCAVLTAEAEPRRPVFERLRELLGSDLTRTLLFGLTRAQTRLPRLPLEERGSSAP
jgi:hypothetical protein